MVLTGLPGSMTCQWKVVPNCEIMNPTTGKCTKCEVGSFDNGLGGCDLCPDKC